MKVIFFDGNCFLCNFFVKNLIKFDKKKILKFSYLNSSFAKEKFLEAPFKIRQSDSIIFLSNDFFYEKSTAILNILKVLKLPSFIIFIFSLVPKFLRDYLYDFFAKNRYCFFGKEKKCHLKFYQPFKERLI